MDCGLELFRINQFSYLICKGTFTYDVRCLGMQVGQAYGGQAASYYTKQAYVVKYLIRVGQKYKTNI